jgi:hypothetical protein
MGAGDGSFGTIDGTDGNAGVGGKSASKSTITTDSEGGGDGDASVGTGAAGIFGELGGIVDASVGDEMGNEGNEGNEVSELRACEDRNADVLGLPGGACKTMLSVPGVEIHSTEGVSDEGLLSLRGGKTGEGAATGRVWWMITSPWSSVTDIILWGAGDPWTITWGLDISTERTAEDGVPVALPRTDVMVGVLMPEGDLMAGSSLITTDERADAAKDGLGGSKGLGKGIVAGESRGICAGETWGSGVEIGGAEGAQSGVGNLTDGSMVVLGDARGSTGGWVGGECTG